MKTIKKMLIILLAAICALSASACGEDKGKVIDPAAIAKQLVDGCSFEEKPEIIEDSEFGLTSLFEIDEALIAKDENGKLLGCIAVCSSTPETVIVIKAVDNDAAKQISEGAIANRVNAYIHDYSNYGPEQINKLNSCINRVDGQYVYLIISADNSAAGRLLDELTK